MTGAHVLSVTSGGLQKRCSWHNVENWKSVWVENLRKCVRVCVFIACTLETSNYAMAAMAH